MPEPVGHYFDADPGVPSRPATVRLDLPDRSLSLTTDRGVFSADRVDPGTKYLLLEAPEPAATGTFVDLGCGYGPIACTLALRAPAAVVWAVDVNERALQLANENAGRLGLSSRFVACTPEQVPTDLRFDEIWSNPPIRIGKDALHELLLLWLPRLAPGGRMVMGIGRGDSAVRYIGDKPVRVAEFERRCAMVKEFMNGREVEWNEKQLKLAWVRPELPEIPMWVAGYGPKALALTGAHDGASLAEPPFALVPPARPAAFERSPRIGISRAVERPWRYVEAGTSWSSRARRAA